MFLTEPYVFPQAKSISLSAPFFFKGGPAFVFCFLHWDASRRHSYISQSSSGFLWCLLLYFICWRFSEKWLCGSRWERKDKVWLCHFHFFFFFPSLSNHQLQTRETSVRREWDIKRSKVERWEIRRHTGSSESLVYELAFLRECPEVLLLLDANVGKGTKGMI